MTASDIPWADVEWVQSLKRLATAEGDSDWALGGTQAATSGR